MNTWTITKARTTVILIYCSTFYFLENLKGKCIKITINLHYWAHSNKDVICDTSNKKEGENFTGVQFLCAIKVGINLN